MIGTEVVYSEKEINSFIDHKRMRGRKATVTKSYQMMSLCGMKDYYEITFTGKTSRSKPITVSISKNDFIRKVSTGAIRIVIAEAEMEILE